MVMEELQKVKIKEKTKDVCINRKPYRMPINLRFGLSVHMVRLERRISQDALATRAQLSRNYISEVERGRRNISLDVVQRIAVALDVDVADLFM